MQSTSKFDSLISAYLDVKDYVIAAGYAAEIDWQEERRLSDITECAFLREAAWVILASGISELVVRCRFPQISKVFFNWASANKIIKGKVLCRINALQVFHHERKIDAILKIASLVDDIGFSNVKLGIQREGLEYVRRLPYMGSATSFHLAKNLGIDVVKPDRHLVRIARATKYDSPQEMCELIASSTGERLSVIDLVIWRFATLNRDYLIPFKTNKRPPAGF
ncbi:MAG: hypothetical protein WAV28_10815 [Sedimentisphaerales bacterium]